MTSNDVIPLDVVPINNVIEIPKTLLLGQDKH